MVAKVYVSSTMADLQPERQAVLDWLRAARHQAIDSYLPDSDTVRESCLDDVAACDLYVLILGHRYGFMPAGGNPDGLSITQLEFRRAGQCHIPRIALVRTSIPDERLSDLQDPARAALVWAFRAEVAREVRPAEFRDLQGLVQGLSTGIQHELDKLAERPADQMAASRVLRLAQSRSKAQAREEEAADALSQHLGRRAHLPLVSACDPLRLGVHPAIDLPASAAGDLDPRIPLYVGRDRDTEFGEWLRVSAGRRGGFALVTGGSSVGKTRFVFQAIKSVLPGFQLLQLDDDAAVLNTLGESTLRLPNLVVWMDELQIYLDGPWLPPGKTPVRPAALRRLLDADTPVVIVATMWPDRDHELRASETDPESGRDRPKYPNANQVLKLVDFRLALPDRPFTTANERSNLNRAAARDPRIERACRDSHYAPTQVLAGARWLVDRWENAPNECNKAVIDAAIAARLLGVQAPLTAALLSAVARGYLSMPQPTDEWFPAALEYATHIDRHAGATAALLPVSDVNNRAILGYTVADYLLQYGTRMARRTPPGTIVWQALRQHVTEPEDRYRLAFSASDHGLTELAEQILTDAVATELPGARSNLVHFLLRQSRWNEFEQILQDQVSAGESDARSQLARLLGRQSRWDEAEKVLRDAIGASEPSARSDLARFLQDQERWDEAEKVLRDAIGVNEPRARPYESSARSQLAWLLGRQSRWDEAVQVLRDGINIGEPGARSDLAWFLKGQERWDEAEKVLRDAIATSEPDARSRLARFLQDRERWDEAVKAWRDAVSAGEPDAWSPYVELLEQRGRWDEAEQILRRGINAGEPFAREHLAYFLRRQDRWDEAVQVLEEAVDSGEYQARTQLAQLLEQRESWDEAEKAWRDAASAQDTIAQSRLAHLLEQRGRWDEAEQILRDEVHGDDRLARSQLAWFLERRERWDEAEEAWRDAVHANDFVARSNLAQFLRERGRWDEAEKVLRDAINIGEPSARSSLAWLLKQRGLWDEAEKVLRDGIGAGDTSRTDLAEFLEERGRWEAEQVREDVGGAGEPHARSDVAQLPQQREE